VPTIQYFGCYVQQRESKNAPAFFVFVSRIKALRKWAGIRRIEDEPGGTQRVLRPARKRAITRFLKANDTNTIPNSILLAFQEGMTNFRPIDSTLNNGIKDIDIYNRCGPLVEWGILSFQYEEDAPEHLRPALIVDGQHRIFGMSEFVPEDLPVVAVAILNASTIEQAFQFVVINNKATRVPTDNVKAIIAGLDDQVLSERLLTAGVAYGDISPILRDINDLPESPFQNLLDWPHNREGNRLVPLTAIEAMIRYLRIVFSRQLEEDESSLLQVFCDIWTAVKEAYPELWGYDNVFMTKVNLVALNEFIVERIKTLWELAVIDIFESEQLKTQILNILFLLPSVFWEREWRLEVQDNANVRRLIKEDLDSLASNTRLHQEWYEGLQVPNME
jgi:DGQHR domain-containing protein